MMKPLLLNQQFIAGIGNYLADEILFRSSIHPMRKANTLTKGEKKKATQRYKIHHKKSIKIWGNYFLNF